MKLLLLMDVEKIKQFRYVTLPGLKYVLSICSLMAMIWTMNGFGIINILTAGGPGVSSTTLPMVIYKTAFQNSGLVWHPDIRLFSFLSLWFLH